MFVQLKSPQALVDAMTRAGVSVRQLAAAAGVTHGTIGHLRTGKNTATTAAVAAKIAAALDVKVTDLFTLRDAHLLRSFVATK